MTTAIDVHGLSKRYELARPQADGYRTLRETIMDAAAASFRRVRGRTGAQSQPMPLWALRDVSFKVEPGEVVGIIGRNGAGKSTLLKILSRVTHPSTGSVRFRGRVGSLLEVGTGFHPELTGRENTFLNGAILGMSRREVKRKFDEIVAFAGVEEFIDTPVKRYSSGMYVRLAFAVAAHLNTEILMIDEVLAVGDAGFQRKCFQRMGEVCRTGGTILLVSHQLAAIQHMCKRALLLNQGQMIFDGDPQTGIAKYMDLLSDLVETQTLRDRKDRSGTGRIRFTGFHLENERGEAVPAVQCGADTSIVLSYEATSMARNVDVGISFHDQTDRTLAVFYSSCVNKIFSSVSPAGQFRCAIPSFPFAPGRYKIGARVVENGLESDWPRDGVGFIDVEDGDFYQSGRNVTYGLPMMMVNGNWSATGN